MAKLTLEKLLERKKLIEKNKITNYKCEFLGGDIEIEQHSISKLSEIINGQYDNPNEADNKLIYEFCPFFRQKELQKAYEVAVPTDIVEAVFESNINEIQKLAKAIVSNYGLNSDMSAQLKN